MSKRFRGFAERAAREAYDDAVDDRVISPLANKVGGCATVVFVVLFTAAGVGLALVVGRMGGNADSVGPAAIGIGLLVGILLGALTGSGVGRVLRRLLTR